MYFSLATVDYFIIISDALIIGLAIGKSVHQLISHNIGIGKYSFAGSYFTCVVCKVGGVFQPNGFCRSTFACHTEGSSSNSL